MEQKELSICVCGHTVRIFLQVGFFSPAYITPTPHRHLYSEIHLQLSGESRYDCDGGRVTLCQEQALVLPGGMLHCCRAAAAGSARMAFQVELPLSYEVRSLPNGTGALLHHGMCRYRDEEKSEALSAALGVVCAEFLTATPDAVPHTVRERRFLISEFFTRHYHEEVTLSDLAAVLCLGEKQTARLLREECGRTFREELTVHRRAAAHMLMREGKLSLAEIAERVGYRSYSGFWKALHASAPEA